MFPLCPDTVPCSSPGENTIPVSALLCSGLLAPWERSGDKEMGPARNPQVGGANPEYANEEVGPTSCVPRRGRDHLEYANEEVGKPVC